MVGVELPDFLWLEGTSPIGVCFQWCMFSVLEHKNRRDQVKYNRPRVIDLRPLSQCKPLTDVDITGCSISSHDHIPLAACAHIKSLNFSEYTRVSDLSPLSSLVERTSFHWVVTTSRRRTGSVHSTGGSTAPHDVGA